VVGREEVGKIGERFCGSGSVGKGIVNIQGEERGKRKFLLAEDIFIYRREI